jgi:hypothetical protein
MKGIRQSEHTLQFKNGQLKIIVKLEMLQTSIVEELLGNLKTAESTNDTT